MKSKTHQPLKIDGLSGLPDAECSCHMKAGFLPDASDGRN